MLRALVTGSSGFVGRHMVNELNMAGYVIDTMDGLSEDMRDLAVLGKFMSPNYYDVVIHAAAHVGGRVDIENHSAFIMAYNLQLDGAMFEWALQARPKHLVYLSSSAAYPVSLQTGSMKATLTEGDIDLEFPELPDETYGWVKLTGERMAEEYRKEAKAWGGSVHVVRPFSGYGADQDPTYPFRAFINRALAEEDPFIVWGNGMQMRDFIHIDDICAAIMEMITLDLPGPVNLCNGAGYRMVDVARWVCDAVWGYHPEITPLTDKPTGVHARIGNPTKLHEFYIPTIDLQTGITRALFDS